MTVNLQAHVADSSLTIERFWCVAACGDRAAVRELVAESQRCGRHAFVLGARGMDAVRGGSVELGIRLMEQAIIRASPRETEFLSELLLPLFFNRREFDKAQAYLERYEGQVEQLIPAISALRAGGEAISGNLDASRRFAAHALNLADDIDDLVIRMRVSQRVAVAAYHRREFDEAFERALDSLQWAEQAGWPRLIAIACALPHALAHAWYQDAEMAAYYAAEMSRNARLADDGTIENTGTTAELTVAAEVGDASGVERLLDHRARARTTGQYWRENFEASVASVLHYGWSGNFVAVQAHVESLRKTVALTISEKSLCDAFDAMLSVASRDLRRARSLTRLVLSQTIVSQPSEVLQDTWLRHVARVLAAMTCFRIGDTVRGYRALGTRDSLARFGDLAALIEPHGVDEPGCPPLLRGYVRFLNVAFATSGDRKPTAGLTPAELEIMRILWDGTTLADVANALAKSPKTVRCQVASIYAKLGVSNRTQALRRAADLGLAPAAVAAAIADAS